MARNEMRRAPDDAGRSLEWDVADDGTGELLLWEDEQVPASLLAEIAAQPIEIEEILDDVLGCDAPLIRQLQEESIPTIATCLQCDTETVEQAIATFKKNRYGHDKPSFGPEVAVVRVGMRLATATSLESGRLVAKRSKRDRKAEVIAYLDREHQRLLAREKELLENSIRSIGASIPVLFEGVSRIEGMKLAHQFDRWLGDDTHLQSEDVAQDKIVELLRLRRRTSRQDVRRHQQLILILAMLYVDERVLSRTDGKPEWAEFRAALRASLLAEGEKHSISAAAPTINTVMNQLGWSFLFDERPQAEWESAFESTRKGTAQASAVEPGASQQPTSLFRMLEEKAIFPNIATKQLMRRRRLPIPTSTSVELESMIEALFTGEALPLEVGEGLRDMFSIEGAPQLVRLLRYGVWRDNTGGLVRRSFENKAKDSLRKIENQHESLEDLQERRLVRDPHTEDAPGFEEDVDAFAPDEYRFEHPATSHQAGYYAGLLDHVATFDELIQADSLKAQTSKGELMRVVARGLLEYFFQRALPGLRAHSPQHASLSMHSLPALAKDVPADIAVGRKLDEAAAKTPAPDWAEQWFALVRRQPAGLGRDAAIQKVISRVRFDILESALAWHLARALNSDARPALEEAIDVIRSDATGEIRASLQAILTTDMREREQKNIMRTRKQTSVKRTKRPDPVAYCTFLFECLDYGSQATPSQDSVSRVANKSWRTKADEALLDVMASLERVGRSRLSPEHEVLLDALRAMTQAVANALMFRRVGARMLMTTDEEKTERYVNELLDEAFGAFTTRRTS